MEKLIHKKLEEAALKISCICPPHGQFGTGDYEPAEFDEDAYNAALKGAEHGYKEAIAQCKEWLKEHSNTEYYSDGASYCDTPFATQEDMLDTFNFDMNKLLED